MDKLLPPRPLKWVVFILLVVVLSEAVGLTGTIRNFIDKIKAKTA